jgi:DNA-binding winged helix-turn-helix (wHTH) protein
MGRVREKLGDDGKNPQIIINHPREGYSFGHPPENTEEE